MKRLDIIGKKYGRLTVIRDAASNNKHRVVECQCDCGTVKKIHVTNLTSGDTISCGCYGIEVRRNASKKHNFLEFSSKKYPIYSVWRSMKQRCANPKNAEYKNYGGRGITVCDEWKKDFQKFYNWANANGYKKGLQIDRINNNGNYEPNNCRWATTAVQARNKRTNRFIEVNNEKMCLQDASKLTGISRGRLKNIASKNPSINLFV